MINNNLLNTSGFSLECPLAESLDSSIKNSMGINGGVSKENNEVFYNSSNYVNADGDTSNIPSSTGGGGSYVSPEMIQSSIGITTALIQGIKNKKASQGNCKKPVLPESGLNHGKWNAYKDCLRNEDEKSKRELELAQTKLQEQQLALQTAQQQSSNTSNQRYISGDDRILGLPKIAFWSILSVVVLGAGGFIAYKVIKSKKVVKA